VTIVDVEQLGGVMTEQLAALFEEEPRAVARGAAPLLEPPPSLVSGPAPRASPMRRGMVPAA
jgi:cobaltochelatase CobT